MRPRVLIAAGILLVASRALSADGVIRSAQDRDELSDNLRIGRS